MPRRFSVVTGHYSQIIWADTNRVGCGFTSFRDNGTFETNLYVCNYGPAGNFVGLPSYKVGEPCSQCPANTACSTRFPNLCGKELQWLLIVRAIDLLVCVCHFCQNPQRKIPKAQLSRLPKNYLMRSYPAPLANRSAHHRK